MAQSPNNVGLIAGQGRLPIIVARGMKNAGASVTCVGLRDQFDDDLPQLCDSFKSAGIAQIGGASRWAALGALQSHPVIVMDWIFGTSNFREGITNADLEPIWSVGVILGVAAVAWIIGVRRYRSLL